MRYDKDNEVRFSIRRNILALWPFFVERTKDYTQSGLGPRDRNGFLEVGLLLRDSGLDPG